MTSRLHKALRLSIPAGVNVRYNMLVFPSVFRTFSYGSST